MPRRRHPRHDDHWRSRRSPPPAIAKMLGIGDGKTAVAGSRDRGDRRAMRWKPSVRDVDVFARDESRAQAPSCPGDPGEPASGAR